MTPSKACKQAGLKSLRELAELSGQSDQTLTNWYHNKRQLFDLLLLGAVTHQAIDQRRNRIEDTLGIYARIEAMMETAVPAMLKKQAS